MLGIKPIETRHNGYKFRSRLEARWAVYFDAMGIDYQYELEGFALDDGTCYLPDFWLPGLNFWVEVKPRPLSPHERDKAQRLVTGTLSPLLILDGPPECRRYQALELSDSGSHIPNITSESYYICQDGDCLSDWQAAGIDRAISAARGARFEHEGDR